MTTDIWKTPTILTAVPRTRITIKKLYKNGKIQFTEKTNLQQPPQQ